MLTSLERVVTASLVNLFYVSFAGASVGASAKSILSQGGWANLGSPKQRTAKAKDPPLLRCIASPQIETCQVHELRQSQTVTKAFLCSFATSERCFRPLGSQRLRSLLSLGRPTHPMDHRLPARSKAHRPVAHTEFGLKRVERKDRQFLQFGFPPQRTEISTENPKRHFFCCHASLAGRGREGDGWAGGQDLNRIVLPAKYQHSEVDIG